MSTPPLSQDTAQKAPTSRPSASPESRNYHQPGFPVLSFAYALYCDAAFSLANYNIWSAARHQGRDYRGYFDPYQWDQKRRFPMRAMELIAADVPTSGEQEASTGRYIPTSPQSEEVAAFLLAEITGAPEPAMAPGESPPPPARTPPPPLLPASENADRPLLSCLAVIFLNQDPSFRLSPATFLADYALTPRAKDVLLDFGKGTAKFLPVEQGRALLHDLVAEFIKPAACW